MMSTIADVIKVFEKFAPPVLQESYDNSGLQTGDRNAIVRGALVCLDVTEAIIDEAISLDCNLVISHHPRITSYNVCYTKLLRYPSVVIDDNAKIGNDCTIYGNVSVYHSCVIGNRVTIHAGVVIGA